MKKPAVMIMLSVLALGGLALWLANAGTNKPFADLIMPAGVIILVGFALFLAYRRVKSHLRREPAEDEFSKGLMLRASSLSYYISIYFWLFMMYISDRSSLETHSLIGAGIMGMAVIFFLSWIGYRILGWRHE
jgi:hypothetical protein